MTSYQSRLGEGDGIAQELAESQRSISIAEFFEKNKHMLGFDSDARALVTAVKEAVDNSLTWGTPFVYRRDGETKHGAIGDVVDTLIERNRDDVVVKRDGDLEKLRVDDVQALAFDDDYRVDFQRVSSIFRHRVNSDVYKLTVEGNREVELTDYHSVFVLRDGDVVSVETSTITEDDYVVLPDTEWGTETVESIDVVAELSELSREQTEAIDLYGVEHVIERHYDAIREQVDAQHRMRDFRTCDRLPFDIVRDLDLDREAYRNCEIGYRHGRHTIPAVLPVDDDLAELLGMYTADGCIGGDEHETVSLSLGTHERALIERTEHLIESVFDVPPSTAPARESATTVTIPSKAVGLLFEHVLNVGDGASSNRIPRYVFDVSRDRRERFVMGYVAGDCYPTDAIVPVLRDGDGIEALDAERIALATTSDRVSSGIRYLLSSIGFDASLAYDHDGRRTRVDTDHALALTDGGSPRVTGDGRDIAGSDLIALPVTDVERIDYEREWVYDVSVPGDENFMAGTAPLACHNSLDATEEAKIKPGPDIYVGIEEVGDYYRLVVEDNGPGITKSQIPKIFGKLLYGSRFHKREQSLTPDQRVFVRRDGDVECLPIGVLCDAYLPADGEATRPIPDDVEAPSFDRETHEVSWEPVTHAIRHECDEATYEITTEKGRTVTVTGNHSLFTLTKDGETKEVHAGELAVGDTVLAPRNLPAFEETQERVNLLEHISPAQLRERRVYVYGFDSSTLERLQQGRKIRKKPSPDSNRKRTYYRYDGVDILKDSLETNYLERGYLPAETVLELGWEAEATDCELVTDQVGGEETRVPVSIPLEESFMRLLGYYAAEGHVGERQVGFTFGAHERELIEATERAVARVGGGTTTVDRECNSTRVKAFGSPLSLFLENVCGDGAENKRIPGFVFRAPADQQRQFIAALYQGDGSESHPSNELSHTTVSEDLARQLSLLWNVQGVMASTEVADGSSGYADEPETQYRTKVYGEDVNLAGVFSERGPTGEQGYKRVPTALLSDLRVGNVARETVPDSIPGLLLAVGIGSNLEHAEVYQSLIEDALAGECVQRPRYVHNLREMGLLDEDHQPTAALEDLWDTIHSLQGITDTDVCLLPVKTVEEVEPPEYVYDLSVPGTTGYDENFVVANEGALSVKNSRGQQGIGISAAVLYSQLTSGKPAKIISRPKGGDEAHYYELIVDTDENEPEISVDETRSWDRNHGTRIELEMEANLRARTTLHEYVRSTAVVNPHARVTFDEPKLDEPLVFDRADSAELPAETEEIRPHPHGVELGTLIKMLEATDSYSVSGFLQSEFTRVGQKTADTVIDNFRDRHFGREMAWSPPKSHEDVHLARAVQGAVSNKGKEATADFADGVADALDGMDRVTHDDVVAAVDAEADRVEDAYEKTFGSTVRESAVAAAWDAVTGETTPDLYALVDEATTTRKDDAAIQGLADRLAAKFDNRVEDPRHRVTRDDLAAYVDKSADDTEEYDGETFGETAREKVVDTVWEVMETVPDEPPNVSTIAGTRDVASDLLAAMRETDIISPPTDCLAPITADLVEEGLRKEFDADFYAAATRDAAVHGGDPFVVEAGIAYGGDIDSEGSVEVMRFANRVPLVYQRGACATTDVVKSINWRNYGLDQPGGSGIPNGPAVVMVHVASTNVPFTSESKDAVANIPELESEIELAVREAARELKSFLSKRRSMQKRRKKQNKLATILPEMAEKLEEVTGRGELNIDDSLARIMNNVLVEREREDGTVRLVVENNADANADLDVTDIVSAEPDGVEARLANGSDGDVADPTTVEMDGEWFLKWSPTVGPGEEAILEYRVADDATCTVSVDGVEDEKLTVNT